MQRDITKVKPFRFVISLILGTMAHVRGNNRNISHSAARNESISFIQPVMIRVFSSSLAAFFS